MKDANISFHTEDNSFLFSHSKILGYSNMSSNHFHSEYEIYYLIEGERYHFISDRTYHIKPGDIVFINSFNLHRTFDVGIPNHERMLIRFTKEFLKCDDELQGIIHCLFDNKHNVIRLPVTNQTTIEKLLSTMKVENQNKQTGYKTLIQSLLSELLVSVCRYVEENHFDSFEHPSEAHKRISEIAQYINTNYHHQLTLSSLSDHFFISPYYLTRIFKASTGFTIIEYLNNIRVKQAQKLLIESKLKINIIYEVCGFGSVSNFGRVFRSISGCSPINYRNINKL